MLISTLLFGSAAASLTPFVRNYLAPNPQPLSCSFSENDTRIDHCAVPSPGGLTLFTQFWDTYTAPGKYLPARSHGLHGGWPDNCNGSYASYCDASRNITGETFVSYLLNYGRTDLLQQMNKYWINQGGPNSDLWAHEYAKHATCTSTYDPRCYANFTAGMDVVDYAETTFAAFARFPTYDILARGGVVPSNSTTYTLAQLQAAARNYTGVDVYFGCNRDPATGSRTILAETWYFTHVLGTVQAGQYRMVNASAYTNSSCTPTNITYPLRTRGSEIDLVTGQIV